MAAAVKAPARDAGPAASEALDSMVSGVVREAESFAGNSDPAVALPGAAATAVDIPQVGVTSTVAVAAAVTADSLEAASEAAAAQFNRSIGWIPVVGTVYNGLRLVQDFLEFSTAVANFDFPGVVDEVFDMATDVIGMIPLVGAPLIAFVYDQAVGPAPAKSTPVLRVLTVGVPDPKSGVVTGQLWATDPEGDALTFSISTPGMKGGVGINARGEFAYTPTTPARINAGKEGATAADTTDSFVIRISDGHGNPASVTVTVAVIPLPGSAAVIPGSALAVEASRS